MEVNSFEHTEAGLLGLVTDFSVIDPAKALPPERIREYYQKDTKISAARVDHIVRLYEAKLRRLQDLAF